MEKRRTCLNSGRRRCAVLRRVAGRGVRGMLKQMSGSGAAPEMAERRHPLMVKKRDGETNISLRCSLAPTSRTILSIFTRLSPRVQSEYARAGVGGACLQSTRPRRIGVRIPVPCTGWTSSPGHAEVWVCDVSERTEEKKHLREDREGCLSVAHWAARGSTYQSHHNDISERLMAFKVRHKKPTAAMCTWRLN